MKKLKVSKDRRDSLIATKSKETRNKILALVNKKRFWQEIINNKSLIPII